MNDKTNPPIPDRAMFERAEAQWRGFENSALYAGCPACGDNLASVEDGIFDDGKHLRRVFRYDCGSTVAVDQILGRDTRCK